MKEQTGYVAVTLHPVDLAPESVYGPLPTEDAMKQWAAEHLTDYHEAELIEYIPLYTAQEESE